MTSADRPGGSGPPNPVRAVLFLVQTRRGTFEFELPPERLTDQDVVFVCRHPLGVLEERLLIDVCLAGGSSSDAVDIVGAVAGHLPGVGTRVRFCWDESTPNSEVRFVRYLEQLSVLAPGADYPVPAFALASHRRAA